jgi:uncharacterized protein (DUF305 family)
MKLTINLAVTVTAISILGAIFLRAATHTSDDRSRINEGWSELIGSMDKMHMAMGAIERSGNADVDFVRLMLPHHQGAIDMAKTELLHGNDLQMRRLAQEIITDQQSEIELMRRWLSQRQPAPPKENRTPAPRDGKDN